MSRAAERTSFGLKAVKLKTGGNGEVAEGKSKDRELKTSFLWVDYAKYERR